MSLTKRYWPKMFTLPKKENPLSSTMFAKKVGMEIELWLSSTLFRRWKGQDKQAGDRVSLNMTSRQKQLRWKKEGKEGKKIEEERFTRIWKERFLAALVLPVCVHVTSYIWIGRNSTRGIMLHNCIDTILSLNKIKIRFISSNM